MILSTFEEEIWDFPFTFCFVTVVTMHGSGAVLVSKMSKQIPDCSYSPGLYSDLGLVLFCRLCFYLIFMSDYIVTISPPPLFLWF